MRNRLLRAAVAVVGMIAAFSLTASPASAAGIYKSDCSGTYVLGIQVVGPPIYCPDNS